VGGASPEAAGQAAADKIDWSRAAVDARHIRALLGAPDRAIPGRSRLHGLQAPLLVDANGILLAVSLTGANRNDVTQLLPLVQALYQRPIAGKVGGA
jgi:hypothetical protein